jgi:hypothetical protein
MVFASQRLCCETIVLLGKLNLTHDGDDDVRTSSAHESVLVYGRKGNADAGHRIVGCKRTARTRTRP